MESVGDKIEDISDNVEDIGDKVQWKYTGPVLWTHGNRASLSSFFGRASSD